MTTVGDDLLGRVIVAKLKDVDPALGDLIQIRQNEGSSYSVILSPQNADRIILHCSGNNANFTPADVDYTLAGAARLFHLGYPPLLPKLTADAGRPLASIFERIHSAGVVTSLDMALPDPGGPSGQVPWPDVLRHTLPHVDVFLPSIEEIVFMLRRADYDAWGGDVMPHLTRAYLDVLADDMLALGGDGRRVQDG